MQSRLQPVLVEQLFPASVSYPPQKNWAPKYLHQNNDESTFIVYISIMYAQEREVSTIIIKKGIFY